MAPIESEVLRPLSAFDYIPKGAAPYYFELTRSTDPYVAVGAWRALMQGNHLAAHPKFWERLVEMCGHGALRRRAFEFFETEVFEHNLAARVAEMSSPALSAAMTDRMQAELAFDAAGAIDAAARVYLASGDLALLGEARIKAEIHGGPKEANPWLIRIVLIDPNNPDSHRQVLEVLDSAGDAALLAEYGQILADRGIYPEIAQMFAAAGAHYRGDMTACLGLVAAVEGSQRASSPAFAPLQPALFQIKARAEEKLGHFEDAYRDFLTMNASGPTSGHDPQDFYRRTTAKKQLRVPLLPVDPRSDVVQMLGFPRSGTTLLENALAAHPSVETFEEIEALKAAIDVVEFAIDGRAMPPAIPADMYLRARAKYYEEIDLRRQKPGATVLIDKLPLRTSEADFIGKMFPDWRYIFSIRNPYDVVLSCFKQRFVPNPAMENFRTIEAAIRAYDHTMSEWFTLHTLSDPAVHYVRYENLVTDFDAVMTGTLDFLGLEWEDSVRDFASAAQVRASRTPSYQKVRQGIGIGVQTYWQNYRFVFDTPVAAPLEKWAEFFGYQTA